MYALGFAVIGLLINRVGKFPILCKWDIYLILELCNRIILFLNFFYKTVFVLVVSGLGGIACMLTDIPIVQIYGFIALMCSGMGVNIVNSATVELYPTALR